MKMISVFSSNIKAVGYDERTKLLRIEFKSGGIYDYPNISESLYNGLMSADSHDEYHATHIKHLHCTRIH